MRVEIEFDPAKNALNREKHGIGFELAGAVLRGRVGAIIDERHASEEHWICYGVLAGRLFVCVYTMRGRRVRVISLRKANRKEQVRWLGGS
jgi:uncharacterized DUF497 family protein